VLSGRGPWTIRLPDTVLHVVVEDAAGSSIHAKMFVLDQETWAGEPRELRHLQPGPHTLFFAADGYQSAIARVNVPPTGRVDLRVILPAR
jgi:hypothetical protein